VSGGADPGLTPTADELRAQLARLPELTELERDELRAALYVYGIVHRAPRPTYEGDGRYLLGALAVALVAWVGIVGFAFFVYSFVDTWR